MLCYGTGQIVCVFVGKGHEHDKGLFDRSGQVPHQEAALLADLGYVGLTKTVVNCHLPFRKSSLPGLGKGDRKLTPEKRRVNRALSGLRIKVEWAFRRLKVFKLLSTRYRNRRKRFGLRLNLIAAIYNREYATTLLKEV